MSPLWEVGSLRRAYAASSSDMQVSIAAAVKCSVIKSVFVYFFMARLAATES